MSCIHSVDILSYEPLPAHLASCPECSRWLRERLEFWQKERQLTGKDPHPGERIFRYQRLIEICLQLLNEGGNYEENHHQRSAP